MSSSLGRDGFESHRCALPEIELTKLRGEADRVASESGNSCVRHLRKRSAFFDALAFSDSLRNFLPDAFQPVRSILFDKTKRQNWPVAWHQDLAVAIAAKQEVSGYGLWSEKEGFPHVQPPRKLLENMVTIRLHLDDTPSTNGALRVIPDSHLSGKIPSAEISELAKSAEVVCECRAGDILLMEPLLLHASSRAEFPKRRRVVHFEYACDGDLHPDLRWAENAGSRG